MNWLRRANLPGSTQRAVIGGANHSQFGFYGRYPFDGTPEITRTDQITQTVDILLDVLDRADRASDTTRAGSAGPYSSSIRRSPR